MLPFFTKWGPRCYICERGSHLGALGEKMKTFSDLVSLDVYLKEISKVPLMTPEQEHETATSVWNLRRDYQALATEVDELRVKDAKHKRLPEMEKSMKDLYVRLDAAKNRMIRSNCRLVVSIARRYQNHHLHLADLIEEGNIGLMRAVDRFDPRKGFRFSTFAIWWIKQSVIKALKEKGSMIRIPMHISKEFSRYSRAVQEFKNQNGREPAMVDLELTTHLDVERLELLSKIPRDFVSTQTPIGTTDREVGDMLPDENAANQPTEEAVKKDLLEALRRLMEGLSEKEFKIVKMRYGLEDAEPMVLDTIGKQLGITRERVRQIQASALKKMKKAGMKSELNLFLE